MPTEGPLVNLLNEVPCTVLLSSAQSAGSRALVDGDASTSWRARGSDFGNEWIEFRLPEGVSVDHLELISGAPGSGRNPTWGEAPRIRRVRVSREGQAVGEFDLSLSERSFQSLPVSGAAGAWRVEILDARSGSDANRSAVEIAELRVMGRHAEALSGRADFVEDPSWVPTGTIRFDPSVGRAFALRPLDDPYARRDAAGLEVEARYLRLLGVDPDEEGDVSIDRVYVQRTPAGKSHWALVSYQYEQTSSMVLARFNEPRGEAPTLATRVLLVDGSSEHGPTQVTRFRFDDVDSDDRHEIDVTIKHAGPPACGCGADIEESRLVVDADSLRIATDVAVSGVTQCGCIDEFEARWAYEDVNEDGHPDVVTRPRSRMTGDCEEDSRWSDGREQVRLYVPEHDGYGTPRLRPSARGGCDE